LKSNDASLNISALHDDPCPQNQDKRKTIWIRWTSNSPLKIACEEKREEQNVEAKKHDNKSSKLKRKLKNTTQN
jgi:hypothetical protein